MYDIKAHITNEFGGQGPLQPAQSEIYKRVQMDQQDLGCLRMDLGSLALKDHFGIKANRREMSVGNLQLDVYKPSHSAEQAPIVVFVHGGGWKRGSKNAIAVNFDGGVPRALLDQGYMIVAVTYR